MFLSALAAWSVSPASACGGFFCNNVPVDQSGEDIVFAVDEEKGETTVHVQISYTGAAEEFAWIVPVPRVPEILLSNDRLFWELDQRTRPSFQLRIEELFDCEGGTRYYPSDVDAGVSYGSTPSPAPGVEVVNQANVGPYATFTLKADSASALLDWLQENGFDLPDSLDPVLSPYVSADGHFVALKLRKDVGVGALQPIAMRYPGTGASVPIRLTSIAATPDMRLHVYVLGNHRSVPDSYLHVKINDLVVDWFQGGANYEQVITVAADEAGGQAFATDYAGPSDIMDRVLWAPGRYDIAALSSAPDPYTFFDRLLSMGFVGDDQMLELFRQFLPLPESLASQGVSEQDFYNDLRAWSAEVDRIPFDAPGFAAAIDERIVIPLRDAQQMFDRLPVTTRMTSSVSPVEMTADPTFVFNSDMEQEVEPIRAATLQILCGDGGAYERSPRRLVLADGRSYDLPSEEWFRQVGLTEYEYLSELMTSSALVIEDTTSSGPPSVIVDHTAQAFADAEAFNALNRLAGGCGCDGAAVGSGAGAALAALLLAGRRRRI